MIESLVDRHCEALDQARRDQPFGPGTVVWKVHNHMFAAYTENGDGLSVRTENIKHVQQVLKKSRPAKAPFLIGGGWVVLPWDTPETELRTRLNESYRLVRRDWPSATGRREGV